MITIPADGNWFEVPFQAEKNAKGQCVIKANKRSRGLYNDQYRVDFQHTRAVYLRAYYEHRHPKYGWPFIHWQMRSSTYGSDAQQTLQPISVQDFNPRAEIRRMLETMTRVYPVKHLLYSCSSAQQRQIALCLWAPGIMDALGYTQVELIEQPDAGNSGIHWFTSTQTPIAHDAI
ncbi:MAG: hypothetical protein KTR20_05850 [Cellvibrionaceae bacterium]|nr:hypothetical protein [Cellvibrionaceae bacterium]